MDLRGKEVSQVDVKATWSFLELERMTIQAGALGRTVGQISFVAGRTRERLENESTLSLRDQTNATTAMSRICSAEEYVEHLVLLCTGLSPRHAEGSPGVYRLCKQCHSDMVAAASASKDRLPKWWLETRR
ncbi:hypothetical protein HPB50_029060 [Hyalomma asiaticum]|nr:hypothetical protein HPB50_029060 [Hyalomma asiaticum]